MAYCVYHHDSLIQADIQTRTTAAIAINGHDTVSVNTNGRDVVLTGEVASEEIKAQAEKHAGKVYGVNAVDNQLVVAAPEPEPIPEPVEEIQQPEVIEVPEVVQPPTKVIQAPKLEPLPEYSCQQDFDLLLSSNEIHFTTDSAEIDAVSNNLLDDLVDVANQCPEAKIEIGGHTDSRGSDKYNLRLSQARAISVMAYMVNKGVDTSRLTAVGYGESYPIADNETEEGLAKNRRIIFNVKGL